MSIPEVLRLAEAAIRDACHATAIYGDDPPELYREALAAIAALSEGEDLREGMVLVPVEPDETQKAIGAQTLHGYGFEGHLVNAAGAAYRAMIAARKGREEA